MAVFKLHPQSREFRLMSDDGQVSDLVQQIGRGRFCTAYRSIDKPDTVWLVVKEHEGDYSKEILQDAAGPHVPVIKTVGEIGDSTVYRTQYYYKLTAKCKQAWKEYRLLKSHMDHALVAVGRGNCRGLDMMDHVLNALKPDDGPQLVSDELYEALSDIRDAATNYGQSYTFEFAPRNLAVNSTGRLILLDPVFDLETIARDHAKRIKAAQRRY